MGASAGAGGALPQTWQSRRRIILVLASRTPRIGWLVVVVVVVVEEEEIVVEAVIPWV